MTKKRLATGFAIGLVLALLAFLLTREGTYGLTLFVTLPIAVGALGAWIANAQNAKKAVFTGMVANLIASLGFFAGGFEGAICIAMALPLALPLGALGGWLLYASTHRRVLAKGAVMLAIVPLGIGTFGLDVAAKPKVFQVRSSVEIAAPPERVWQKSSNVLGIAPAERMVFQGGYCLPDAGAD